MSQRDRSFDSSTREGRGAGMVHEVPLTVNGYSFLAHYRDEDRDHVLMPLIDRIAEMGAAHDTPRTIVFLAGPPAAGKSTLALLLEVLAQEHGDCNLQAVGLDGFHHYNTYLQSHSLERDGRSVPLMSIKGAPETFDCARFAQKLRELAGGGAVSWPVYDRTIHDPREDALEVTAPLVLVEGNYLLLDEEPWRGLLPLADLTVFLTANEALLRERAVARKAKGGVTRKEAAEHYERSDGPNIHRVLTKSVPADVIIELLEDGRLWLYDDVPSDDAS